MKNPISLGLDRVRTFRSEYRQAVRRVHSEDDSWAVALRAVRSDFWLWFGFFICGLVIVSKSFSRSFYVRFLLGFIFGVFSTLKFEHYLLHLAGGK